MVPFLLRALLSRLRSGRHRLARTQAWEANSHRASSPPVDRVKLDEWEAFVPRSHSPAQRRSIRQSSFVHHLAFHPDRTPPGEFAGTALRPQHFWMFPVPALFVGLAFSLLAGAIVVAASAATHTLINSDDTPEPGLVARLGQSTGTAGTTSVAFSRDGRTLVTKVRGQPVQLWSVGSYKATATPVDGERVGYISPLTPEGKLLVLSSPPGALNLHLWDVAANARPRPLRLSFRDVAHLAFAADGAMLALASAHRVVLWDLQRDAEHVAFEMPDQIHVASLAFASDGQTLAIGGASGSIRLWDRATGKMRVIEGVGTGNRPEVVGLRFLHQGWGLVAATAQELSLWDVASGKMVWQAALQPPPRQAIQFALSVDGRVLASGLSGSPTITIREVITGGKLHEFRGPASGITSLAFSPDGRLLAAGDPQGTGSVWTWRTGLNRGKALPGSEFTEAQLEALWEELAGHSAIQAGRAHEHLCSAGDAAVRILQRHVRASPVADEEVIDRLLTGLNSDRFSAREAAFKKLQEYGAVAEPLLRTRLRRDTSVEVRQRLAELLDGLERHQLTPTQLAELRSVAVLEEIGTRHAQELLRELAKGDPAAPLTQEAKRARDRLSPK